MAGKRKKYSAELKAKVALEAIRGDATIAELVMKHGVHQTVINTWKRQAIEGMAGVFSGKVEAQAAEKEGEIEKLRAKIGQLLVERDFWREPPADERGAEAGDDRAAASFAACGAAVRACIEALEDAMARHGCPEIFNTDQGSQFTSPRFTEILTAAKVKISMDGRGRWIDNVMIERLWRSLKYECVYLNAFETGSEARTAIGRWIAFYNTARPHSALGGRTPVEVHQGPGLKTAA